MGSVLNRLVCSCSRRDIGDVVSCPLAWNLQANTIHLLSWNLPRKAKQETQPEVAYTRLRSGIVELLKMSRRGAARTVNSIISSAYWEIGRRIVQEEQNGKDRRDMATG
jgi:hypothetical protein